MNHPRHTATIAALSLLLLSLFASSADAQRARSARQPSGRTVLVLVGMPGSGKTTAADRIATRLKGRMWKSGDVIRNTIKARGLAYTAANDVKVAQEFAGRPGEIGRRMAVEVKKSKASVAVVEGFRSEADLNAFRKVHPDAKLISIEVGAARRHGRMLARGRAGENNHAFLRARDRREVKNGVSKVMRRADIRIRPRGNNFAALDRSLARALKTANPSLAKRFRAAVAAEK